MKLIRFLYAKTITFVRRIRQIIQRLSGESIIEVKHLTTDHSIVKFSLLITNDITLYRAKTFSTKEPETLRWIDTFGGRGVFYDIGANIGVYSIYHAMKFDNNVFAFEPSLFNLQILAKNIHINNLSDQIIIIPNPVSEANVVADFNLSSIEDGGAHSTFKENYNYLGKKLNINFQYKTLGLSLDNYLKEKLIPPPTIIKIDVDGIEHLILKGADTVLKNSNLISVLIEVHPGFEKLKFAVESQMRKHKFKYNEIYSSGENQVWIKP